MKALVRFALLCLPLFGFFLHASSAQAQVYFAGTQPVTLGGGFLYTDGVAVDAAGDVFVADQENNAVKEIPVSCIAGANDASCVLTLGGGFAFPYGVAVDAAGDVFVADQGNLAVKEIPASCIAGANNASCVLTLGGGFNSPLGVAVDAAGDVFVGDSGSSAVKEIPASCIAGANNASCVLSRGGGFNQPWGVAVDAAGDLFVADSGNGAVKEIPASCIAGANNASCVLTLGGGFSFQPSGVAVDGAGNVFVADDNNVELEEILAPGGYTTVNILVDAFTRSPYGVAVDAHDNVFVASRTVQEFQAASVNFGSANVCPNGQITPAPCNQTLTLNYNIPAGTTIGSVNILTTGVPNLDFQAQAGDTSTTLCTPQPYDPATTCTVDVTFAPLAPGQRSGAVQLFDNSTPANLIAQTLISGIGQGPAIAFAPGVQITVPASGLSGPQGVAVDAAGDVFIADSTTSKVIKVTPSGVQTTVPASGLSGPQGVAVDGAGDLFIADSGHNRVVEVTPSGVQTTVPTSGLSLPTGVAVDAAGDVFITSTNTNRVVKVTPGGVQTTVPFRVLYHPYFPAVDEAGDIFVVNSGINQVWEVTPGGVQTTVPASLSGPNGLAVDAAGDVFISNQYSSQVVEVTPSGVQTTVFTTGLSVPAGLAVDGAGDLFIGDYSNHRVVEVQRSQPSSLNFADTLVGTTSSDSLKSATVQNIGNQPLNGVAPGLVVTGPNFVQVPGSGTPADCTSDFALAPGGSCNLSFSFEPQSTGLLTGAAVLTDNALNAIPAASQSIALQGQGFLLGPGTQLVFSVSPSSSTLQGFPLNPIVQVEDANGFVVTSGPGSTASISIALGSNPGGGSLSGTTTVTAVNGVAEFPGLTINNPGSYTLTVGSSGLTPATSASFNIFAANPGDAAAVAVGPQNGTLTLGTAGSVTYLVTVTGINDIQPEGRGSQGITVTPYLGSALPPGVSASFSPSYLYFGAEDYSTSQLQTTLTISTSRGTPAGVANLIVAARGNFDGSVAIGQGALAVSEQPATITGSGSTANVCPAGQTTPAPCSGNITVQFYSEGASLGPNSVQVVTQGAPNLDFTLASTTCTGSPTSCTANITFTPRAPGVRMGAVNLTDAFGNLLDTVWISGIGNGPAIAFGPGIQTTVPAGLSYPYGVAVDAAGDVFIADQSNAQVYEVTPGGVQTTIPTIGLGGPTGVAVDGAGNVFIADPANDQVLEVTPSGFQTTVPATGLGYPQGVAVDAAGDLFIADGSAQVFEITPTGVQTTVPATGLGGPTAVAVDAAGDLFISDPHNNRVVEVTPGGVQTTVPATGLSFIFGLAVDAAGDVFIADILNNRVVEVTAAGFQTTVLANGLGGPTGVALDAAGDLFIADPNNGQVVEMNLSQPPSLSFATTNAGATSSDSPQAITFQNVGNATLTGSGLFSDTKDFMQVAGPGTLPDCTLTTLSLAPGAECNLSIDFNPLSGGPISASIALTDNALNVTGATQAISLSGSGVQLSQTITFGAIGTQTVGTPLGLTAMASSGLAVSFASTTSSVCMVSGTTATFLNPGMCSITASQSGSNTYTAATPVSQSFTVNAAPQPPLAIVSSTTLNFPNIAFPGSETMSLTVTNIGGGTLSLTPSFTGQAYTIQSNGCSTGVSAGASCTLQFEFTPSNVGLHDDVLTLNTNGATNPKVSLNGKATGIGPNVYYVNFGSLPYGSNATVYVKITNQGVPGPITLTETITGHSFKVPTPAQDSRNTCAAGFITHPATCILPIEFDPTSVAVHTDALTITAGNGMTSTIELKGIATQPLPKPPSAPTPPTPPAAP